MTIALLVLLAAFSLAWAAFCAGAETGFLSVSRERILHLSRMGGRKAVKVQRALMDMGRTTTTLLVGNNMASVLYSSCVASLSARLFADNVAADALCSFFAALIVLYVSEFMPKLLFATRPLRRTLAIAGAYEVMARILSPVSGPVSALVGALMPRKVPRYKLTASDLVRILQDRKDGVCLSDFESALISRLIVLRVKGKKITPEAILSALRDFD